MTERERVKKIIDNFYKKTLANEIEDNMCFTACYALSEHLKNNHIEHYFVLGSVNNKTSLHYWLGLNNDTYIIDPTPNQEQFGHKKPMLSPYFDELPKDSYEIGRIIKPDNDEFNRIVEEWRKFWLGDYTANHQPKEDDIPKYLRFFIKAEILLNNDLINSASNKEYFDIVYIAYRNYSIETTKPLFEKLPEGWEEFYLRFCEWQKENDHYSDNLKK